MTSIDRRTFVKALGAGTAGIALGCTPKTTNGSVALRKIDRVGIQLYTVRTEMEKDFEGTLSRIAGIGYKEVEFAGYFNHSPADVRAILDRLKITAPSAHISLGTLTDNWQKTIDNAKVMGHEYLIVAYLDESQRKSLDDYRRHADLFNSAGEIARKSGVKLGYHNHDFEFKPLDGQIPYDVLLSRTDPNLVRLELDLFWITNAGQSPLTYFSRVPGRIELVHVKDMDAAKKMVDVGKGTINWAQIFAQRDKAGIKHFFVEHDNPPDPLASAATSYQYLSALTF